MDIMALKYVLIFLGMGAVYWFLDSRTRRRLAEVKGMRLAASEAVFTIAGFWRALWLLICAASVILVSIGGVRGLPPNLDPATLIISKCIFWGLIVPLVGIIISITWCACQINVRIMDGCLWYDDGYKTIQRRLNEIVAVGAAQGIITVTCLNPKRSFRMPAGFNDNGLLIGILKNEVKGLGR